MFSKVLSFSRFFLASFFSFEFLFVLFLFAGKYKADPRFGWIPFDLTAFFFVVSMVYGLAIICKRSWLIRRGQKNLIAIIVCFFLYIVFSLLWTPSVIYAQQKALYIATLVLWSFGGALLIVSSQEVRIKRLFVILVLFALWMAVESTLFYIKHGMAQAFITALGSGDRADNGGEYLGLGRAIGLGFVITFYYFYCFRGARKYIALFLSVFFLIVLFLLGGRGPLLAACLPFICLLFFKNQGRGLDKYVFFRALKFAIVMVLIFLAANSFVNLGDSITVNRFSAFLDAGLGGSAGTRAEYYWGSFAIWLNNPVFGNGVGSWPIYFDMLDERNYPHNIFIEILTEFGLIGFSLFCGLLISVFRKIGGLLKNGQFYPASLILLLFLNAFINASVSGDLPDNRVFFAMIGLAGGIVSKEKYGS